MTNTAAATGDDPEAIKRKERSERILASEGVPINSDLPLIRIPSGSPLRDTEEVSIRALCLLMVAIKADRMDQTMALRVIRQYGLAPHFTPMEKEFVRNAAPTDDEKTALSSKYEAAWALLWALGYVDALSIPNQACNVNHAIACMRDRKKNAFLNEAKLRSVSQLLDQTDLTFRYHRSMTDAEQAQRDIPAGLKAIVVNERLNALNWLILSPTREWDDLSVDS